MRVIAVIPARFASLRLPGKPLLKIQDKPMIQWVYESAKRSTEVDDVVVATDDQKIIDVVKSFGGKSVMTDLDLQSGTDRVAAVSRLNEFESADIFVNVQGDEPMMESKAIDLAVKMVRDKKFEMATIMTPLSDPSDLTNPAVVKVVFDKLGRALYFSRHPIPYSRKPRPDHGQNFACRRHVGLYVYTKKILHQITALPPSPLEQGESLEQLRAMEDGVSIGIAELDFLSIGVDTPEELEKVRSILK